MDTSEQLARIERLRQIIIRSTLAPENTVYRVTARSQHDDRYGFSLSPQSLTQGQSILAAHHDVQYEDVEGLSQQQAIDQLQVLQQQFAAQQAETRKSSGEVAALGDKFETLRQSFASVATPAEDVDAQQNEKAKPAIAHSRRTAWRLATPRKLSSASRCAEITCTGTPIASLAA